MTAVPRVKEKYILAGCCNPVPDAKIVGYFSHDDFLKVHDAGCSNLDKVEAERLVMLEWQEILAPIEDLPDVDISELDELDFAILKHHREYGIDYSLVVARKLVIDKETAFERHRKLRDLRLIERIDARMVQYRKGIVDNRWIKHRNHTYYGLTSRGERSLDYYESQRNRNEGS